MKQRRLALEIGGGSAAARLTPIAPICPACGTAAGVNFAGHTLRCQACRHEWEGTLQERSDARIDADRRRELRRRVRRTLRGRFDGASTVLAIYDRSAS